MWPWRCGFGLGPAGRRCVLFSGPLVLLVVGCSGGDGPDRVPLCGNVTIAGSPVARGTVSFLPAKGHSGPAATTAIEEGRYEFGTSDGPVAGPHRVVVSLPSDDKKRFTPPAAGRPAPSGQPAPSAGPSKKRWEIQAEVPAKAPFQCDIALD